MANPDFAYGAFQKHALPSRLAEKKARKAAELANWREVCKAVNERDQMRCRACGHKTNPGAMDSLQRGHHHHIDYRSAGGMDTTENVCLVCPECHEAEHRHVFRIEKLTPEGANGPLQIYRFTDEAGWFVAREESAIGRARRD